MFMVQLVAGKKTTIKYDSVSAFKWDRLKQAG